jgi:uncharacterized protein YdaU (DUF1376 family)
MPRLWMPFYWGDYMRDTAHLSTVQHGAYLLLIGHYWSHGGLPDDDQQLANITRLAVREWRANRAVVQQFFYDGWKHKRIEFELKRQMEIRAKRAVIGSKGGTISAFKRWRK